MKMKLYGKAKRGIMGIAFLSLLAVCGYAGIEKEAVQAVSISVSRVPYELEGIGTQSLESAASSLKTEREKELELLKGVAESEAADDSLRRDALRQIAETTRRMEVEAQTSSCLTEMGIKDVFSVMSAQGLTLIMPEDSIKNEETKVRVIDAASGVSGCEAADIKIILAKK